MSLELHARNRGSLKPDPEFDPVLAVFYYVHNDWSGEDGESNCQLGVIAVDNVSSCGATASPQKAKVK